jgi:hypothetical protein
MLQSASARRFIDLGGRVYLARRSELVSGEVRRRRSFRRTWGMDLRGRLVCEHDNDDMASMSSAI